MSESNWISRNNPIGLSRGPSRPIMMNIQDITARRSRLKTLSHGLSTFKRVTHPGTSTPRARQAAANAERDIANALKRSARNLDEMASVLGRRISYMTEFDREYPIKYATVSDIEDFGRSFQKKYENDPARHYDDLKKYAMDPDFAEGFIRATGVNDFPGGVPHPSQNLSEHGDFSNTMGMLVGSSTRNGVFKEAQLKRIFLAYSTDHHRTFEYTNEFFDGLTDGASLRPPTLRMGKEKATALTRALVEHVAHMDREFGADDERVKRFRDALDLSLARDAEAVYGMFSGENIGDFGGLERDNLQTAVSFILTRNGGTNPDNSTMLKAIATVHGIYVAESLRSAGDETVQGAIDDFDNRYAQLNSVLKNLTDATAHRDQVSEAAKDARNVAIKQALFVAAATALTLVTAGVASPAIGVTIGAVGAGASSVPLFDSGEANRLFEEMGLEGVEGPKARQLAFASAKLRLLRNINAPASHWPDNWQRYFIEDKSTGLFRFKRDSVRPDDIQLGDFLRQDELKLS